MDKKEYTKEYLTENKVAIHTPTKKEYDKVMEKMGRASKKPTEVDYWGYYEKETCVRLYGGDFGYCDKDWYEEEGYTIITAQEFLAGKVEPIKPKNFIVFYEEDNIDPKKEFETLKEAKECANELSQQENVRTSSIEIFEIAKRYKVIPQVKVEVIK